MRVFVSAAEVSSDIHATIILSALSQRLEKSGKKIQIAGIGGEKLRSLPGFQCIEKAESLRAMGFVEVLGKLFHIRNVLHRAKRFIQDYDPDLIITFDYPDFHFKLMKSIQPFSARALKVCGIPPKVWVWRSKRVEKIRQLYNGVWVILPFEKDFYEARGIPVIYEGNPLIQDLLAAEVKVIPTKSDELAVAVMPGSRDGELKYHLPVIPETLELFSQKISKRIQALVPIPGSLDDGKVRQFLKDTSRVHYQFVVDGSVSCLRSAPLGLIKSGTSTLEAAVLGCVPVIFYKVNQITEWIFQFGIRYAGPIGLPNILMGIRDRAKSVFPEFLGPEATPASLSDALLRFYQDQELQKQVRVRADGLKQSLVPHVDLGVRVAEKLFNWQEQKPYQIERIHQTFLIYLASQVWSSVNWVRRTLHRLGILSTVQVKTPSVLVGNLQAGGSGKTPVVIALAKEAVRRKMRVAVVSRGYGSKNSVSRVIEPSKPALASEVGDEPAEIRKAVPVVYLGIGANRVRTLELLPEVDLILFDDGFQNLSFKSLHTLLLMTGRARSEVVYRDFFGQQRFAEQVLNTDSLQFKINAVPEKPIWILCAVANPSRVAFFYQQAGVRVRRVIAKPDHSLFEASEVRDLIGQARQDGSILSVTEKDFVKLVEQGFSEQDFFVLRREIDSKDWLNQVFERLQSNASFVRMI